MNKMRLIDRLFKCNNCMGEIWYEAGAYCNTPPALRYSRSNIRLSFDIHYSLFEIRLLTAFFINTPQAR